MYQNKGTNKGKTYPKSSAVAGTNTFSANPFASELRRVCNQRESSSRKRKSQSKSRNVASATKPVVTPAGCPVHYKPDVNNLNKLEECYWAKWKPSKAVFNMVKTNNSVSAGQAAGIPRFPYINSDTMGATCHSCQRAMQNQAQQQQTCQHCSKPMNRRIVRRPCVRYAARYEETTEADGMTTVRENGEATEIEIGYTEIGMARDDHHFNGVEIERGRREKKTSDKGVGFCYACNGSIKTEGEPKPQLVNKGVFTGGTDLFNIDEVPVRGSPRASSRESSELDAVVQNQFIPFDMEDQCCGTSRAMSSSNTNSETLMAQKSNPLSSITNSLTNNVFCDCGDDDRKLQPRRVLNNSRSPQRMVESVDQGEYQGHHKPHYDVPTDPPLYDRQPGAGHADGGYHEYRQSSDGHRKVSQEPRPSDRGGYDRSAHPEPHFDRVKPHNVDHGDQYHDHHSDQEIAGARHKTSVPQSHRNTEQVTPKGVGHGASHVDGHRYSEPHRASKVPSPYQDDPYDHYAPETPHGHRTSSPQPHHDQPRVSHNVPYSEPQHHEQPQHHGQQQLNDYSGSPQGHYRSSSPQAQHHHAEQQRPSQLHIQQQHQRGSHEVPGTPHHNENYGNQQDHEGGHHGTSLPHNQHQSQRHSEHPRLTEVHNQHHDVEDHGHDHDYDHGYDHDANSHHRTSTQRQSQRYSEHPRHSEVHKQHQDVDDHGHDHEAVGHHRTSSPYGQGQPQHHSEQLRPPTSHGQHHDQHETHDLHGNARTSHFHEERENAQDHHDLPGTHHYNEDHGIVHEHDAVAHHRPSSPHGHDQHKHQSEQHQPFYLQNQHYQQDTPEPQQPKVSTHAHPPKDGYLNDNHRASSPGYHTPAAQSFQADDKQSSNGSNYTTPPEHFESHPGTPQQQQQQQHQQQHHKRSVSHQEINSVSQSLQQIYIKPVQAERNYHELHSSYSADQPIKEQKQHEKCQPCEVSSSEDLSTGSCLEHTNELVKHMKRLSEYIPSEAQSLVKEMANIITSEPIQEIKRQAERILGCALEAEVKNRKLHQNKSKLQKTEESPRLSIKQSPSNSIKLKALSGISSAEKQNKPQPCKVCKVCDKDHLSATCSKLQQKENTFLSPTNTTVFSLAAEMSDNPETNETLLQHEAMRLKRQQEQLQVQEQLRKMQQQQMQHQLEEQRKLLEEQAREIQRQRDLQKKQALLQQQEEQLKQQAQAHHARMQQLDAVALKLRLQQELSADGSHALGQSIQVERSSIKKPLLSAAVARVTGVLRHSYPLGKNGKNSTTRKRK